MGQSFIICRQMNTGLYSGIVIMEDIGILGLVFLDLLSSFDFRLIFIFRTDAVRALPSAHSWTLQHLIAHRPLSFSAFP
jgi:hypothetical protein